MYTFSESDGCCWDVGHSELRWYHKTNRKPPQPHEFLSVWITQFSHCKISWREGYNLLPVLLTCHNVTAQSGAPARPDPRHLDGGSLPIKPNFAVLKKKFMTQSLPTIIFLIIWSCRFHMNEIPHATLCTTTFRILLPYRNENGFYSIH